MNCICGGKTRVVDRRGVFRRRECEVCKERFSTKEMVVDRAVQRQVVRTRPESYKPRPVHKFAPGTNPAPELKHQEQQQRLKSARARLEELREERRLRELNDGYETDHN